jgi:hypothetical protein
MGGVATKPECSRGTPICWKDAIFDLENVKKSVRASKKYQAEALGPIPTVNCDEFTKLGEDFFDHLPMDVGQPKTPSLEAIRQSLMIHP